MKLKLTPKLALVLRLFAAALLAGVVLLSYINGQRALKDAAVAELQSTAGEKQAALEGWIGEGAIFHFSLPANRLKACLRESDTVVRFGASIGVSIFPDTARDSEFLIKGTDPGMYSAKQQGGRICFDQEGGQA